MLGVERQEGYIAVQTDPDFTVQARDLRDCQETELERVAAWLDPPLRAITRLAFRYAGGGYAGKLRLTPRTPEVDCDTVTNVRITDRTIEETILLNYNIRNAGIHELTFLLPASMADARISTPMLRRMTKAPVGPKVAGSPLRVRLELQNDAMNDLRVKVENDRLLTPGSPKDPHTVPLPGFEAAAGHPADFVRHQYIVLEIDNRDELVVDPPVGLEPLSRQQRQWQILSELLGSKQLYKAYLAQPGASQPRLDFYLQRHEEGETVGARIDLAQTTIVIDANGAYRAKVELSLDNSSEQFLDVELPEGAALWTASVAGQPVKPAGVPGAGDARHVLLPVRKTAKGDLNYLVVLKYGGKLAPLALFSSVQFPLVRNVKSYPRPGNIGIEQTQVQIYVPKSHQWFDFGGTMHATEDSRPGGRTDGRFQQAGAAAHRGHPRLGSLRPSACQRESEGLDLQCPRVPERGRPRREQGPAEPDQRNLQHGRSGQERLEVAVCHYGRSMADNRQRLNDLYEKQVNVNANGTLALTGANSYSGGTTVNAGTLALGRAADFNPNWMTRNNLNTMPQLGGQGNVGNANPSTDFVAIFAPPSPAAAQPQSQMANPASQSDPLRPTADGRLRGPFAEREPGTILAQCSTLACPGIRTRSAGQRAPDGKA